MIKHRRVLLIASITLFVILALSMRAEGNTTEAVTIDDLPPSREQVINNLVSVVSRENIDEFISIKAEEYGVNEWRFREVVKCESQYNPLADNPNSSALGIMQIMNGSFADFARALKRRTGIVMTKRENPYHSIESSMIMIQEEAKYASSKRGGWYRWAECLPK